MNNTTDNELHDMIQPACEECYEDIMITVVDLFETVGYEEFGIVDKERTLN